MILHARYQDGKHQFRFSEYRNAEFPWLVQSVTVTVILQLCRHQEFLFNATKRATKAYPLNQQSPVQKGACDPVAPRTAETTLP